MKTYFLDTSILIGYLRNKQSSLELINNLEGKITSSYLCLAELFEGIYLSRDKKRNKKEVLELFTNFQTMYGIDKMIAEEFGRLKANLGDKGILIGDIDTFIAATCIVNDLTLVTNNKKHFSRIKELKYYE